MQTTSLKMIHLRLSESDWLTSKKYWKELSKNFVSPDAQRKAHFVNQNIFESSGIKNELLKAKTQYKNDDVDLKEDIEMSNIIPSINTMNQIMNEIDKDLAITTTSDTIASANESYNTTIDKKIQKFIVEPVELNLFVLFFLFCTLFVCLRVLVFCFFFLVFCFVTSLTNYSN